MVKRQRAGSTMIIDYLRCVHVERGDESLAGPTVPYHCPECCLTTSTFSGKLKFSGSPIPVCEDHDPPIQMEI